MRGMRSGLHFGPTPPFGRCCCGSRPGESRCGSKGRREPDVVQPVWAYPGEAARRVVRVVRRRNGPTGLMFGPVVPRTKWAEVAGARAPTRIRDLVVEFAAGGLSGASDEGAGL